MAVPLAVAATDADELAEVEALRLGDAEGDAGRDALALADGERLADFSTDAERDVDGDSERDAA